MWDIYVRFSTAVSTLDEEKEKGPLFTVYTECGKLTSFFALSAI
jgi:hypothetical protein